MAVRLFSRETEMSASFSALQLGFLSWQMKWCQGSVWSDCPKDIKEMDDLLDGIDLALPALTDGSPGICARN